MTDITEYGDIIVNATIDEWGRRRTDGLLEDGTKIIIIIGGQVYEIYVDAITQYLATSTYETTYNIREDAAVANRSLYAQENTYNVAEGAVVNVLADVLVEALVGVIEIFKEAIATAHALCQTEATFKISLDAMANALTEALFGLGLARDVVVEASASGVYEVNFVLPLCALVNADTLSALMVAFNISSDATVEVQAEVSVVKPTEVRITRLFLVIGDLAIQIQGN